jgi:hypothetical protein
VGGEGGLPSHASWSWRRWLLGFCTRRCGGQTGICRIPVLELCVSSERVGSDEAHFNAYHFAIGDTSYQLLKCRTNKLSLADLTCGNATSVSHFIVSNLVITISPWNRKQLVEYGYGASLSQVQHCLGLLAPGDGKSESYIIPTIARHLANQRYKTIIHISPYSFLAGYQFANATTAMKECWVRVKHFNGFFHRG